MIEVYSSEECPQCAATKRFLSSKSIPFTPIMVTADSPESEFLKSRGQMSLPVIIVKDAGGTEVDTWTGLRLDKLLRLPK